uniref:glutamate formimidoyltransferase n=1 Tax=Ananas comosus var. bracteatus TaxID=296719 RepID=A0A6V7PEN6_ANACO|nr:unnamed protein product [Ananas comosus var. bracteatus]
MKLYMRAPEITREAKLACCKIYISEGGRNALALDSIERAAKHFPEVGIINRWKDEIYNRVGYTVVSRFDPHCSFDSKPLQNAAASMVEAAFASIDLRSHCGTHPRLGVVDHVCFHPLAGASLDQAAGLAKSAAADIACRLQVPTYLYGAAHDEGRSLDSIRRELGYYKPNSLGYQWKGGLNLEPLNPNPDLGPTQVTQSKGILIIGATGWVGTYNVPIFSTNIELVRRIARGLSGRGGGFDSVQAIGLMHGEDRAEVACNLLDPMQVGSDQIQARVERLAGEEGLAAGKGYFTDFSPDKIVDLYLKSTSSI